jgi:protein-tyrosine phosphatase
MSWYVHENRYGFADGPIDEKTFAKVKELAKWLHKEWKSGARCLSRCQAGANRSGLVMGVVLMIEGYTATDAIDLIRNKRGPYALFNDHFVGYLKSC